MVRGYAEVVSKSRAFPAAMEIRPESVLMEKRPASFPAVIEYVMVSPSGSLSVPVLLSLRLTIEEPAAAFSAIDGDYIKESR